MQSQDFLTHDREPNPNQYWCSNQCCLAHAVSWEQAGGLLNVTGEREGEEL